MPLLPASSHRFQVIRQRVFGRAAALALATAAVLACLPQAAAEAHPADAETGAHAPAHGLARVGVDWGVNHDGWHVHIINDTGYRLSLVPPLATDNAHYASRSPAGPPHL
jgi:hypothetical protein